MALLDLSRIARWSPLLAVLAVALLTPPVHGQDPFDVARVLPFVQDGSLRSIADLDVDGDPDLILFLSPSETGVAFWSGMQTWLNQGGFQFTLGGTVVFDLGSSDLAARQEPVIGDVTGDGIPDVLFDLFAPYPPPGNSGVKVYPGLGNGTFESPLLVPTGFVSGLALANLDTDPALELAVFHSDANFNRLLDWWDFNGSSFVSPGSLNLGSNYAMQELTVIDLGGDGVPDLVAAEGTPTVLRYYPTMNKIPTLGSGINLPPEMWNVNHSIRTGDLNGDGLEDFLAVTRLVFDAVTYFLPMLQGPAGVFTPQAMQTLPDPSWLFFFHSGFQLRDWDNDGDADAMSGGGVLTILENVGGQFVFRVDEYMGGSQVYAGATDLNGDGFLDFVDQLAFLRGRGDFVTRQSITEPPKSAPKFLEIEDWEGDGDVDLTGIGSGFFVNDAAGNFKLTSGSAPPPPPQHFFDWSDPVAYADLNGDGTRDYLLKMFKIIVEYPFSEFQYMVLLPQTASGAFIGPDAGTDFGVRIDGRSDGFFLHPWPAGDLDGDGDQDLLASNGYWRNDGTGFFDVKLPAYSGNPLHALDFDDNGLLDLLVTSGNQLVVLYQQPGPSFQSQSLGDLSTNDVVQVIDLNQDGDQDVTVQSLSAGKIHLSENIGQSFAARMTLDAPGVVPTHLGVSDVTHDGRPDLMSYRSDQGYMSTFVTVYPRTGLGFSYGSPTSWACRQNPGAFLDIDGDGDVDPLMAPSLRNRTFDGPAAGAMQQYGAATAGSGNVEPVMGASGPMRAGVVSSIRVRRTVGDARGVILTGLAPASLPLGPHGPTLLVAPPFYFRLGFRVDGTPGAPGDGSFTVNFTLPPEAAGLEVFEQAFVFDPAGPLGLAATNGNRKLIGQ